MAIFKKLLSLLGVAVTAMGAYIPTRLLSRIFQIRLQTIFLLVRFRSWVSGTPLPPRFNTPLVNLSPEVEPRRVRWLAEAENRRPSDPVILYYHGGGYGLTLVPQQAASMRDIYWAVGNPRLSVLVLDYTTTVEAQYPIQLKEAAATYNSLAETCDNIILLGDSAGGHLSLQVMRLLVAPVEGVPRVTKRASAFLALSPLINFPNEEGGMTIGHPKPDVLTLSMLIEWGKMYSSDKHLIRKPEIQLETEGAVNWDAALPEPHKIFFAYCDRELMADSITRFLQINNLKTKGATIYTRSDEIHDSLMVFGVSDTLKPTVEFIKGVC